MDISKALISNDDMSRRQLGKALLKSIRVSSVGVYNVDGANELWSDLKKKVQSMQKKKDVEHISLSSVESVEMY
jgi:hypothetical protein